jgi:hypothetical protein
MIDFQSILLLFMPELHGRWQQPENQFQDNAYKISPRYGRKSEKWNPFLKQEILLGFTEILKIKNINIF